MSQTGGSIESVTLDGRTFSPTSDADTNRKLGGYENDVQANGDGTARMIKTRIPWGVDGLSVAIDDQNGDHEFLQALADGKAFFPLTVSYVSGAIWQGDGQIVGELQFSNQNAVATMGLMGTGKFTKQ